MFGSLGAGLLPNAAAKFGVGASSVSRALAKQDDEPPLRRNGGLCRLRVLWTNADDRLPADPLGRIVGCNGIVEGRDVADVRPHSSLPHLLDDLTQLSTIGQDN